MKNMESKLSEVYNQDVFIIAKFGQVIYELNYIHMICVEKENTLDRFLNEINRLQIAFDSQRNEKYWKNTEKKMFE